MIATRPSSVVYTLRVSSRATTRSSRNTPMLFMMCATSNFFSSFVGKPPAPAHTSSASASTSTSASPSASSSSSSNPQHKKKQYRANYKKPRGGYYPSRSHAGARSRRPHPGGHSRQRQARPQHQARPQRQKLPLKLGLEEIQSIWNSFSIHEDESEGEGKGEGEGESGNSFNLESFVEQFPHVNPKLTKSILSADADDDDDESNDDNNGTILPPLSWSIRNPVAEEAEEKLQNMTEKIVQHYQDHVASKDDFDDDDDDDSALILSQIQSLLDQELDVVIQIWLNIASSKEEYKYNSSFNSNSNSSTTTQDLDDRQMSMMAVDRAAQLVLEFRSFHEKGMKSNSGTTRSMKKGSSSSNNKAFHPLSPSLHSSQMIIHHYHDLCTTFMATAEGEETEVEAEFESETTISSDNISLVQLDRVQERTGELMKGFKKKVFAIRVAIQFLKEMQEKHPASMSDDEAYENDVRPGLQIPNISSTVPLNETYNHAISIHTTRTTQHNLRKKDNDNDTENENGNGNGNEIDLATMEKDRDALMEKMNVASELLNEMELLWHDFFSSLHPTSFGSEDEISLDNPTTSGSISSSSSNDERALQTLLFSIHPTYEIFKKVIGGYVRIATDMEYKVALLRANHVLDRMYKRHRAYREKDVNEYIMKSQVCKPDASLYTLVLGGYVNVMKAEELTKTDAKRVLEIVARLEEENESFNIESSPHITSDVRDVVEQCREISK